MRDYEEKVKDIGQHARVLVDLHLESPEHYSAEMILEKLVNRYEKLGFEPIKPYEVARK